MRCNYKSYFLGLVAIIALLLSLFFVSSLEDSPDKLDVIFSEDEKGVKENYEANCRNAVQDEDEEGVDCGGSCEGCSENYGYLDFILVLFILVLFYVVWKFFERGRK